MVRPASRGSGAVRTIVIRSHTRTAGIRSAIGHQRELETRQFALHGPEASQDASLPPRQLSRVDGAPRRSDLRPRAGADVSRPHQRADLLDEETVH